MTLCMYGFFMDADVDKNCSPLAFANLMVEPVDFQLKVQNYNFFTIKNCRIGYFYLILASSKPFLVKFILFM